MCADFKYEKENIELRRGRVLELLARGHSHTEIAKSLNVSNALISLDVQYFKEQAKKELETNILERYEGDFFRRSEQEEVRHVAEQYIAKSDPYIVMVSTPNRPDGF